MTLRTLQWAVFLTFCTLPGSGEPMTAGACTAPVSVYTHFEQAYSEPLLENMKEEVRSIMAPIGLELQWRTLDAHAPTGLSSELAVVSFKGKCRMDDLLLPSVNSGNLGWSYALEGHVSPFSDVDCDRVRQFINPSVLHAKWVDRDAILGRALGRVLAHELYHIFADSKRHARVGLAKAFFSPRDLVSDHFTLEERDAETLRNGKLHGVLEQAASFPSCP
ncbi:MAG: hypothetical protein LAP39_28400 [Acidobacteriia bacterium]|nr:hypothetical protein [Terriglobia bacterium]